MSNASPTPLTDLLLRLSRARRAAPWHTLARREDVLGLLGTVTDWDLRVLQRCFPGLATWLLRRLQRDLDLPAESVGALIARMEALPPRPIPDPFDTPKGADWAVERFRLLFERRTR